MHFCVTVRGWRAPKSPRGRTPQNGKHVRGRLPVCVRVFLQENGIKKRSPSYYERGQKRLLEFARGRQNTEKTWVGSKKTRPPITRRAKLDAHPKKSSAKSAPNWTRIKKIDLYITLPKNHRNFDEKRTAKIHQNAGKNLCSYYERGQKRLLEFARGRKVLLGVRSFFPSVGWGGCSGLVWRC